MKLRYYLRGLGIGIVVTALVMGFSRRDARPLTDAEIKARAAELGMVESSSLQLADIGVMQTPETTLQPEGTAQSGATSQPEATATPGATAQPESTATPEVTAQPEATATPEATQQPEATATPGATVKPEGTAAPENTAQAETVEITVTPGMASGAVCRLLEEAGLVQDAAQFDRYLINNNYSKRISTGTYQIAVGSSEEKIAKIITKSY